MNYKLVNQIKIGGFPTSSKKYPYAHRKANEAEKQKYGTRNFKALEKVIQKRLPIGELAGTHTKEGQIRISKRIPKKYRAEIEHHERIEHLYMIKK